MPRRKRFGVGQSQIKNQCRKGEIMGKFMKMGVVLAVMLSAAGAFASNFRVADQVYVPVAGHIASSRLFLTDVYISNVEDDSVDVSVMYIDASGIKQFPKLLTLAPRERREI